MIIAKNITANETTNEFQWPGGPMYIYVTGTFDGATVQLNAGMDNLPKIPLDNGTFIKSSYVLVKFPQTGQIDFTVLNAGPTTDISIAVSAYIKEART